MSIEMVAALGSAIGGLISFFLGCSVGRWAKSRAFRSSVLERDVQRIVLNPSSDNPRTFVPEAENAKLRELVRLIYHHDRTPTIDELEAWHADGDEIERRMRELGIEVDA